MDTARQQLLLKETLRQRRTNDGWWEFQPTPPQRKFIDAALERPAERTVLFLAGNRAGKTRVGAYVGAALARFGDESARYVGAKGSTIEVRDRLQNSSPPGTFHRPCR